MSIASSLQMYKPIYEPEKIFTQDFYIFLQKNNRRPVYDPDDGSVFNQ